MFHVEHGARTGRGAFALQKNRHLEPWKSPCFPQIPPQARMAPFRQAKQLKNKVKTGIFVLLFQDYAARPSGVHRRRLRFQ